MRTSARMAKFYNRTALLLKLASLLKFSKNNVESLSDGRIGLGVWEEGPGQSVAFDGTSYGKLVDRETGAGISVAIVGQYVLRFSIKLSVLDVTQKVFDNSVSANRFDIHILASNTFDSLSKPFVDSITIDGVSTSTIGDTSAHEVEIRGTASGETLGHIGAKYDGTLQITGNLYNIYIATLDAEGNETPIFSNFLAQDNEQGYLVSEVGPDVQLVDFTYPYLEESLEFGHVWGPHSEYSSSDNYLTNGGDQVIGKVPASPTNASQDVFGNALTHPGYGQRNAKVTGFTGAWDGVAYAVTEVYPDDIDSIGLAIIGSALGSQSFIMGVKGQPSDNRFYIKRGSTGSINAILGDDSVAAITGPVIADGEYAEIELFAKDGIALLTVNGVEYQGTYTGSVSGGVYPIYFGAMGDEGASSGITDCTILNAYTKSDGELTHNWIGEAAKDSDQDTIYDVVGGNHATLVNAALPFFTEEMEGSYLLKNGFTEGEPDGVELVDTNNWSTLGVTEGTITEIEDGVWQFTNVNSLGILRFTDILTEADEEYLAGMEVFDYVKGGVLIREPINDSLNTISSDTFYFAKGISAGASAFHIRANGETTLKIRFPTLQLIPKGQIPANPATGLSALGQPLTNRPGQIKDAPVLIEMKQNGAMFEADNESQGGNDPINLFTEPDGDSRKLDCREDFLPQYGEELWVNPTEQADDGNGNFSTYDPVTGVGRIVAVDTTMVNLDILSVLTIGKRYQVSYTELAKTSGYLVLELMSIDGMSAKYSLPNGSESVDLIAESSTLSIKRGLGGDDVSFKLSVKEITGNGQNINDQYFLTDSGKELLLFPEPISSEELTELNKYLANN